MKICIIGDFSGKHNEGMKNIAFYLTNGLLKDYEIMKLNIKKIFSFSFWRDVQSYDPQIVHYLTGPGFKSFLVLKFIKIFWSDPKTIMSALHPVSFSFTGKLIPFFKPHLMLTQSYESERIFQKMGCNTMFSPNGVDTERFIPASVDLKKKLRGNYGLSKEKFIILHVGHLIKDRNLQIFNKIQQEINNQVIIVASSYFKTNEKVYETLRKAGCLIWRDYFENIEEIYALSDCYIFPVKKGCSILTPLSVMEAMSCNLPVITTRFEGLLRTFNAGDGLIFAETENDFVQGMGKIKKGDFEIKTREKVLPYSWENIAERLERIYESMVVDVEP